MKKIFIFLIAVVSLIACHSEEKPDTGTADKIQQEIDSCIKQFEATKMVETPERSQPRLNRVKMIKEVCAETHAYMKTLLQSIGDKNDEDFEASKTVLFLRIDETNKKLNELIEPEQYRDVSHVFNGDDKAAFNKENAPAIIKLLITDLKIAELSYIKVMLQME
jgi:hypothetical protein